MTLANNGKITEIILFVPSEPSSSRFSINFFLARHYRRLITYLGEGVRYIIVAHQKVSDIVAEWFVGSGCEVDYIGVCDNVRSPWAQDYFISFENALVYCDLLFRNISRETASCLFSKVPRKTGIRTKLVFQAGNILAGAGITLVGADLYQRVVRSVGKKRARSYLQSLLGSDLLVLGGERSCSPKLHALGVASGFGYQPIFHIDCFVTRTGSYGKSGREVIFLGRPAETLAVTGGWAGIDLNLIYEFDTLFNEIESQLCEHFEVHRIPLMLTHGGLGRRGEDSRYYFLSFNNVIIEKNSAERKVIIPNYSSDSFIYSTDAYVRRDIEHAAYESWRSVGFQTKATDGVEDLAFAGGGIRCLVKDISRVSC